jgi:hypothetical protein
LTDEHASMLQIKTNILNRDGIVGRIEPSSQIQPMLEPNRSIAQMQPWVRQFMAAQDLLFALDWTGHSSRTGRAHCNLQHRNGGVVIQIERPSADLFKQEVSDVMALADLRAERAEEILSQIDHQWGVWGTLLPLRPDLKPRTLEVLQAMVWLCVSVEMRFKQVMGVRRPQDLSVQVQPIITTPGHGTFPMGHATQAYAVAEILRLMLGLDPQDMLSRQLQRQAHRIAFNRIVAGVHFPVDLAAGMLLGQSLARFAHACVQSLPAQVFAVHFREAEYKQHPGAWSGAESLAAASTKMQHGTWLLTQEVAQMPVWTQIWHQAQQEWGGQS